LTNFQAHLVVVNQQKRYSLLIETRTFHLKLAQEKIKQSEKSVKENYYDFSRQNY